MPSGTFVVVADSAINPTRFYIGKEIAQADGHVTFQRAWKAPEPQPDGTTEPLACVLSVQEDGSIGWRREGTAGPFELADPKKGFYLYAPGVRLHGDLKLPVYSLARFTEFNL